MKAVLQNFRSGDLSVSDVPPPSLRAEGLLVRNVASLVSAGTEKAVIALAKMNPLRKARERPDLVRKVLNRAGQEGLLATAQTVINLISSPLPLGYSCAGIVDEVGARVTGFQPGDRVACAGLGYANHAEVVYVPRNLAIKVPNGISFEEAAFVTVGAIAMQGVRQGELAVGESVVVLGLGLVGQLVAQICVASGCRVFGLDLEASKVELARKLGAQNALSLKDGDVLGAVRCFTRERGADCVIICAATSSSEPIKLAAEVARDRARIVALGDVGLDVPRRAYFEKELDLRQSRSYGPGRYDPAYEEQGHDYPAGYVRWTENRNMESFLDLVAEGKVAVQPLITHRFPIEQAQRAYSLVSGERSEPYIGISLEYDADRPQPTTIELKPVTAGGASSRGEHDQTLRLGVIGAGQFAQGVLLPYLRKLKDVEILGIATGSGLTARIVADKYHCQFCTSDYREILARNEINSVLIATRHSLHAEMVCAALASGKHVFVEKPLAVNDEQLSSVIDSYQAAQCRTSGQPSPMLMVGYNRRFSPLATRLRELMHAHRQPLIVNYRVNAGPVPDNSWVQDPVIGGGRIVGEVCHFIDLIQYLTGAEPIEVFATALGAGPVPPSDSDSITVQIRLSDGSLGTVIYTSQGDPKLAKERIEVFGGGMAGVIENWRRIRITGNGNKESHREWLGTAKGHAEELAAFAKGASNSESPIAFSSLVLTSRTTFAIQRSLRTGQPVPLSQYSGIAGLTS